jgi:hypothetical protein
VQWAVWDLFQDASTASHLASYPVFLAQIRAFVAASAGNSTGQQITLYEPVRESAQLFINIGSVPEPTSLVLLGLGLLSAASLSSIRRKR